MNIWKLEKPATSYFRNVTKFRLMATYPCQPRTLYKKDSLLLMFLLFFYSTISIETRLITHFRVDIRYNYTSRKSNVICFKPRFWLFHLLKYYKILYKYSFCIGFSDILNKLETIVYSLCLKKQTI